MAILKHLRIRSGLSILAWISTSLLVSCGSDSNQPGGSIPDIFSGSYSIQITKPDGTTTNQRLLITHIGGNIYDFLVRDWMAVDDLRCKAEKQGNIIVATYPVFIQGPLPMPNTCNVIPPVNLDAPPTVSGDCCGNILTFNQFTLMVDGDDLRGDLRQACAEGCHERGICTRDVVLVSGHRI